VTYDTINAFRLNLMFVCDLKYVSSSLNSCTETVFEQYIILFTLILFKIMFNVKNKDNSWNN